MNKIDKLQDVMDTVLNEIEEINTELKSYTEIQDKIASLQHELESKHKLRTNLETMIFSLKDN